jgi:hypothetical protein
VSHQQINGISTGCKAVENTDLILFLSANQLNLSSSVTQVQHSFQDLFNPYIDQVCRKQSQSPLPKCNSSRLGFAIAEEGGEA